MTEERRQITDTDIEKLSTTQKKQTMQNSKTKLAWFRSHLRHATRPGNEVGLFYNAPEPHEAALIFVYLKTIDRL